MQPGVILDHNKADPKKTKEAYWRRFVQDWFLPQATIRLVLGEGQQGRKEFGRTLNYQMLMKELPNSLIHHFFHTIHTSGVRQMHIMLGAPQNDPSPHVVECQGASILYRFENGPQVIKYDTSLIPGHLGWFNKSNLQRDFRRHAQDHAIGDYK